jgi:hypothetical protein
MTADLALSGIERASAPLLAIYGGPRCFGFVLARDRSGFEALDNDERGCGTFRTLSEAATGATDAVRLKLAAS